MDVLKKNWYILIGFTISFFSFYLFNVTEWLTVEDLRMRWNATHYAINYVDFGFVKRGFVGSVYHFFNGSLSQNSLLIFQLFLVVFFVFSVHFFFLNLGLNKKFIYVVFMLSPATFMQVGFDFGRFDSVLVSFFMLSVIYRSNSFLFFLFSVFGILIHEIYIFSFLPAAFILYLNDSDEWISIKNFIINSIGSRVFNFLMISIFIILSKGVYESGYQNILDAFSKSNLPSSYVEFHTKNDTGRPLDIWTRSIMDNFEITIKLFSMNVYFFYMVFVCLFILYKLELLGVSFKKPKYLLVLISSFPMFFLGTDWARWLAFIYISIFVVFITTERENASRVSNKFLLMFCFYGPLGIGGFLPPLVGKVLRIF